MRGLKAFGSTQIIMDGRFIHLVASKLEIKWEEALAMDELPTWVIFSRFLERRCRMLENLGNSVLQQYPKHASLNKSALQSKFVHVSANNSSTLSAYCGSNEHFITNCILFNELSPSARFQKLKISSSTEIACVKGI